MGRRTLIWLVAAVALLIAFFGGFELHSRTVSHVGLAPDAQAATIRDEVVTELQNSYYRPLAPRAWRSCIESRFWLSIASGLRNRQRNHSSADSASRRAHGHGSRCLS
jgi:hypothetical protein